MSEVQSFWKELRERRVMRVAVAYLAVAWMIVEGADTLTSVLALPAVTARVVFALLALGFPLAVVLAWAFQRTADGLKRAAPFGDGRSRQPFFGGLAVGALGVAGVAWVISGSGVGGPVPEDETLDEGAVAVLPFRVSAPDELSYLGGGLMDLLAARLDGDVGPRSVDPGLVASVARRDSAGAASVARSVGAAMYVSGSAVGDRTRLIYDAQLVRTADGARIAEASTEGHPDSLTAAVDVLVGQLLSLSAGEYAQSVEQLTSTSPEALRAYLRGKEAWRAGRYFDAADLYDEALAHDSTFALAAIARADAGNMATGRGTANGLQRAWRHRDRLGARDLLYLETRLPPEPRTHREAVAAYERLTRAQPDRVEAWYWLGEIQIHSRGDFGPDWADRIRAPFQRSLELEPTYFPSLEHLILLESKYGDDEELRAMAVRYGELRPTSWIFRGLAAGESFRLEPDDLPFEDPNDALFAVILPVLFPARAPAGFATFVDAAIAENRRRTRGDIRRSLSLTAEYRAQLGLGRRAAAEAVLEEWAAETGLPPLDRDWVDEALWERVAVERAEATIGDIERRMAGASGVPSLAQVQELVTLHTWRALNDPTYVDPRAPRRIRTAFDPPAPRARAILFEFYALMLEAWNQVRSGDEAEARVTLARLDEVIREHGNISRPRLLAIATIFEELGDPAGALGILERRSFASTDFGPHEVAIWRLEGRYAAAAGDTARAVQAYRDYLKLREGTADPSLQAEVSEVRSELGRLTTG